MPDKIKFGDVGSDYEPSLSEDEYSEGEKELLKKVRQRRRDQYDDDDDKHQQAVLGFDDDDEYYEDEEEPDFDEIRKFEHDSDIEDKDDEDDLPSRFAWGSKSSAYYGTGYVDKDYDTLTAKEEELALLEEQEAMEMQKRRARHLAPEAFEFDEMSSDEEGKDPGYEMNEDDVIVFQNDFSRLSQRERQDLFRKTSPEFAGMVKECSAKLNECVKVLEPALQLLKNHNKLSHPLGRLLTKQYELNLLYCSNISFYVLLKSKKVNVRHHPIVQRILHLKRLVQEMDKKYEQLAKGQVDELLKAHAEGMDIIFNDEVTNGNTKSASHRLKFPNALEEDMEKSEPSIDGEEPEDVDSEPEESSLKRLKLDVMQEHSDIEPEEDEQSMDVDGKRKITYQMAKNKGLTTRKRKDQRNIRVKNKLKYRKALIRRKGAIREVRTETTRYSGETSIKPFVKRGIKLK